MVSGGVTISILHRGHVLQTTLFLKPSDGRRDVAPTVSLHCFLLCFAVATGAGATCSTHEPVVLREPQGRLANAVTQDSGHGTSFCPWEVRLHPGQKINITLVDFGVLWFNKESPICQVRDGPSRHTGVTFYPHTFYLKKRVFSRVFSKPHLHQLC